MNFIAFIFLMAFASGPVSDARGFPDLEACQAFVTEVTAMVTAHNASGSEDKITHLIAVCEPIKKAPMGLEVRQ